MSELFNEYGVPQGELLSLRDDIFDSVHTFLTVWPKTYLELMACEAALMGCISCAASEIILTRALRQRSEEKKKQREKRE